MQKLNFDKEKEQMEKESHFPHIPSLRLGICLLSILLYSCNLGCKARNVYPPRLVLFSVNNKPVYVSEIYKFTPVEILLPPFHPDNYITNDESRARLYSRSSSGVNLSQINALLICDDWSPILAFVEESVENGISFHLSEPRYSPKLWEHTNVPSIDWILNHGNYALERFYFPEGGCSPPMLAFSGFNYKLENDKLIISIRQYVMGYDVDFFMYNQIDHCLTIVDHKILDYAKNAKCK